MATKTTNKMAKFVLILILLEDTLWSIATQAAIAAVQGLNPYSTGRYSLILHRLKDSVLADMSLNPYSTGRYSLSDKKHFEDFSVRAS